MLVYFLVNEVCGHQAGVVVYIHCTNWHQNISSLSMSVYFRPGMHLLVIGMTLQRQWYSRQTVNYRASHRTQTSSHQNGLDITVLVYSQETSHQRHYCHKMKMHGMKQWGSHVHVLKYVQIVFFHFRCWNSVNIFYFTLHHLLQLCGCSTQIWKMSSGTSANSTKVNITPLLVTSWTTTFIAIPSLAS